MSSVPFELGQSVPFSPWNQHTFSSVVGSVLDAGVNLASVSIQPNLHCTPLHLVATTFETLVPMSPCLPSPPTPTEVVPKLQNTRSHYAQLKLKYFQRLQNGPNSHIQTRTLSQVQTQARTQTQSPDSSESQSAPSRSSPIPIPAASSRYRQSRERYGARGCSRGRGRGRIVGRVGDDCETTDLTPLLRLAELSPSQMEVPNAVTAATKTAIAISRQAWNESSKPVSGFVHSHSSDCAHLHSYLQVSDSTLCSLSTLQFRLE